LSNTTLQGWGRGTWGQGPWNQHINVEVTNDTSDGIPEIQATASVNSVVGVPSITASVTGLSATTAISQTGASTATFTVTVVSGNPSNHPYYNQGSTNKYAIGGSTATADVTLTMYEGNTYRFDQSDSSNDGHPINLYEDSGKNTTYTSGVSYNIDGSSVSQSSYVDTTTFNAGTTRYVEITVPDGAPTIHYQCYNHALMGYQANTLGIPNVVTTTGAPVSANTPVSLAMTSALGPNFSIVTTVEVVPSDYNDRLPALQAQQKSVVTVPQCVVSLTGVSATGGTGEELVYSLIVPNQTANWQEVA
tara:strand:+ start:2953 stop:3867 length:915 start_codon:yes stop_codon:yes gene_type:complete